MPRQLPDNHGDKDCPKGHGLAESLQLVRQRLVPHFASAENFERLLNLTLGLPPVFRAGFEYRLNHNKQGLDFQQAFNLDQHEVEQFTDWNFSDHAELTPVVEFCREWARHDSDLRDHLRQLWVEFDCPDTGETTLRQPSVFIGMRSSRPNPTALLDLSRRAYEQFTNTTMDDGHLANLRQVITAAPRDNSVCHVGFMLGREHRVTRVIIPFFDPQTLTKHLDEIGWDDDKEQLTNRLDWLFTRFNEVRLCLDVGQSLSKTLGFECFFNKDREAGPDHKSLFDDLITEGYCKPCERDALLAWPGRITPDSNTIDWPEELIVRSIAGAENEFSVIDCHLSHIKFSWPRGSTAVAKAYFGYIENWKTVAGQQSM